MASMASDKNLTNLSLPEIHVKSQATWALESQDRQFGAIKSELIKTSWSWVGLCSVGIKIWSHERWTL